MKITEDKNVNPVQEAPDLTRRAGSLILPILLLIALLLLIAAPGSSAESTTILLDGPAGSVSGVTVEVIDTRSGLAIRSQVSDQEGRATFPDLPDGISFQAQTANGRFVSETFTAGDRVTLAVGSTKMGQATASTSKGWEISLGVGASPPCGDGNTCPTS